MRTETVDRGRGHGHEGKRRKTSGERGEVNWGSKSEAMVERKREARPGVAGSKNAGRPTRLMGGKEDARRNIPAPLNNELMEALVRMCVQLLHDPAFCNAKVGARCLAHVPREHRARELMPK